MGFSGHSQVRQLERKEELKAYPPDDRRFLKRRTSVKDWPVFCDKGGVIAAERHDLHLATLRADKSRLEALPHRLPIRIGKASDQSDFALWKSYEKQPEIRHAVQPSLPPIQQSTICRDQKIGRARRDQAHDHIGPVSMVGFGREHHCGTRLCQVCAGKRGHDDVAGFQRSS
jgi:hypothetical protein